MKFLVDASSDARLVVHLRQLGHDATRVGTDYPPALEDIEVLDVAQREQRILITDDRDFGDLVFRRRHLHAGVIYLRLDTTVLPARLARLDHVLTHYRDQLDQFIVVTAETVRVRQSP